jgi:hypothetical protein
MAQGAVGMSKYLRWLLIALLVYFIIVFPNDAAELTQELVGAIVALFVGAANAIADFLRAFVD